jgi:hypothetical protein
VGRRERSLGAEAGPRPGALWGALSSGPLGGGGLLRRERSLGAEAGRPGALSAAAPLGGGGLLRRDSDRGVGTRDAR